MNQQERPLEDLPGTGGVEVLPRQDEDEDEDDDAENGEIGGTDDNEADDEDEAGGLPAL